jgi:hypothetical protein
VQERELALETSLNIYTFLNSLVKFGLLSKVSIEYKKIEPILKYNTINLRTNKSIDDVWRRKVWYVNSFDNLLDLNIQIRELYILGTINLVEDKKGLDIFNHIVTIKPQTKISLNEIIINDSELRVTNGRTTLSTNI